MPPRPPAGRGTGANPANRFEPLHYDFQDEEHLDAAELPAPRTKFFRDASRSIISRNDSPDVPFEASINVYRGCEHGCSYCYARPTHEYLGFSAGLDFESRILVKEDAPRLLRGALSKRSWKPVHLAMSGVTDPYQPVERRLRLTRACLEVLADFRNPVGVITKNVLVTRDIDVLERLARHDAAAAYLSLTTLRDDLSRTLEPRASFPARRLQAIRELRAAGIPTGVLVAPVIPGLNDHEVPAILEAAREAGAQFAGYVMLRLPHGLKDLFSSWLQEHVPDRRQKVLSRVRSTRGGALNQSDFRRRMSGEGPFAEGVRAMFRVTSRKLGFERSGPHLSTDAFRRPSAAADSFLDLLYPDGET